jgi:hypothetical protein
MNHRFYYCYPCSVNFSKISSILDRLKVTIEGVHDKEWWDSGYVPLEEVANCSLCSRMWKKIFIQWNGKRIQL